MPLRKKCFERLRLAEAGETVACVHCESEDVVKRGTTGKDAQQYCAKSAKRTFTNTIFDQHRFDLEDMFYIVKEIRSEPTAQIVRDRDRDYEAVLNCVHEVHTIGYNYVEISGTPECRNPSRDYSQQCQDVSGEINEFDLYGVCEADKIYTVAGEKGVEDEDGSPRSRGLLKGARNLRDT